MAFRLRSPLSVLRRRVFGTALGLVCAVSAAGCQEEETGLDSSELSTDELAARCGYLVRCGFAPDQASCRDAEEVDRGLVQAVGGIEFDRVGYDKDAAEAYIAALEEVGCEATLENARLIDDARRAVFDGQVGSGKSCFADDECSGEAICERFGCDGSQVCCTGTCVGLEVLSAGTPCPLTSDGPRITARCSDTTYCAAPPDDGMGGEPPAVGTCAPRVDNGMACNVNEQCLDGQRCDGNDSGTCYRLAASGEMCNPAIQSGSCIDINEICDAGTSKCVDAPAPGAPCVFGRCQPFAECRDDMCVARPRLGEFCDGSIQCLGDLDCRDEVCQRDDVVFVCVEGEPPPPPPEGG